jgi:glycosyltransferase involved in cell wall biosynthesis
MARTEGVSVIICCYNSALRLEPTLTHLFNQKISPTIDWEIIVVNNNSTDNTVEKATNRYAQTDRSISLRIVDEQNPGLSHARNKGFETAKYDFVLMVDDDNWLSENYVETVFNDLSENPNAAMVGGLGIPELECKEPTWFTKYASCYATGTQSDNGLEPIRVSEELYGAGCALKLSALDQLRQLGFSNILSDRTGSNLMSGGDTELCYAFRLAGFELLYNERISFQHFLPKGRVDWKYLRKLFHGFGMTKTLMDIYVSAVKGSPVPNDNQRFPYWFNRMWFLLTDVIKDADVLFVGVLSKSEGNHKLLTSLAKIGQLKSTFIFRNQLIHFHQQVQTFKTNAQKEQNEQAIETADTKPLVTVLLPVYNAEKYLPEAIESILNQTFQDFELLIINDGSTDGSLRIIKSYTDLRIRVLNLEQNVGLVKALNIGLSEVHSEYIIRTDADDINLPNRFEVQLAFMQQNKDVGVCGSWFDTIGKQGEKKGGTRYKPSDEAIRFKHLYQINLSHGTAILRTSVLKENSIYYSSHFKHAEDYDIFDRIGMVAKLANIQQTLYVVRLHDTNVSKTFGHVQKDNSLGVKRRIFTRLGVTDITDEEIEIYQELQHQNYKPLADRQKEVLVLLSKMFESNEKTLVFKREFFRVHLASLWFHYCNAITDENSWDLYHSAKFIASSDLRLFEKVKFRIKPYLHLSG